MTKRFCSCCGMKLPGRRGHGFVSGGALVCGRREVEKTVYGARSPELRVVPTPKGCWA